MGERGEENMVGLTTEEAMREADRNAAGCLAASAVAVALLGIVAGWLVYLACSRWPVLCERLPPLGFISLGVALQMVWRLSRAGRATHG